MTLLLVEYLCGSPLQQTQYLEIIEILDFWVLKAMINGIFLIRDTFCEK